MTFLKNFCNKVNVNDNEWFSRFKDLHNIL